MRVLRRDGVAASGELVADALADGDEVARPAHLADEAAAWLQDCEHALGDCRRVEHPVERRVRECSVELAEIVGCPRKAQRLGIGDVSVDTLGPGRFDHFRRGVEPDHLLSRRRDVGRQRPVAAPEIEDDLARPRVEQGHGRSSQSGDERGVGRIIVRAPAGGAVDGHWLSQKLL